MNEALYVMQTVSPGFIDPISIEKLLIVIFAVDPLVVSIELFDNCNSTGMGIFKFTLEHVL
jgi:hypothetical protein